MTERLLDTQETLKRLNISRTTLHAWMKRGVLHPADIYPDSFRKRPKLYFHEHDVNQLMPREQKEIN